MAFIIPLSILAEKIFFNTTNIIGPNKSPSTPINLNPVYIAISVKIGCIPILLLTSFGSRICFTTTVKIYKPNKAKANPLFSFNNSIKTQGKNTVPAPKYR